MLGVHIVDTFQAFQSGSPAREDVFVGKQIILPLIVTGEIQHDVDELHVTESSEMARMVTDYVRLAKVERTAASASATPFEGSELTTSEIALPLNF